MGTWRIQAASAGYSTDESTAIVPDIVRTSTVIVQILGYSTGVRVEYSDSSNYAIFLFVLPDIVRL